MLKHSHSNIQINKMCKIAILMDMPLYPYRIYCYNELAKREYDLTVVSVSNKTETYNIPLKFTHSVLTFKKIGPFIKLNDFNIHDYDKYDIVIVDPNLRILDYYQFYNRHWWNKLIGWGHLTGRTTGNKLAEMVRFKFFKRFRALVFYDDETRKIYTVNGFDRNNLFVANNTQYVDPATVLPNEVRNYFLYVGRIQERKGLDIALKAFARLKKSYNDVKLEFIFVGGGDTESLKNIAEEEKITNSVRFVGPIHDQKQLGQWFAHAIAYVSPGHVGLGVLHSFACGVPVITCSGRLHSVEIANCNSSNSLIVPYAAEDVYNAMKKLYTDKVFQQMLSKAAYKHYWEYCTIDKMVDGIDEAIKHITK